MENEDDQVAVSLNMDHPLNKSFDEFMRNAPPEVVDAWFARLARRMAFDRAMDQIGGLTAYRRKLVVRSLVRMFRAGFVAGHTQGFFRGEEAAHGR